MSARDSLLEAFAAAGARLLVAGQIEKSEWLAPRSTTYFLSRGLAWERL